MPTRPNSSLFSAGKYEDFEPLSEWKEEEMANILILRLPGFHKEDLKITYINSTRSVRVVGERLLENTYKRKRFNQPFPVPQNCKVNEIHAKLYNGNLIITMPKEIISQVIPPKDEPKTTQKPPIFANDQPQSLKNQQETPPKAALTTPLKPGIEPKGQQETLPKAVSTPPTGGIEPKSLKGQEDNSLKASSSNVPGEKQTDGKRSVAAISRQESTDKPKSQKGQYETPSGLDSTTDHTMKQANQKSLVLDAENVDQKIDQKKERTFSEGSGKFSESKKPEIGKEKTYVKEKETSKISKESVVAETPKPLEKEKERKSTNDGKEKPNKEDNLSTKANESMKVLKKLGMELSEERQAMINMGVAALVIVALGAYVSYRIWSSAKSKD